MDDKLIFTQSLQEFKGSDTRLKLDLIEANSKFP